MSNGSAEIGVEVECLNPTSCPRGVKLVVVELPKPERNPNVDLEFTLA